MDAKSRPTFKEIVQNLEEALAFPLSNNSKFSNLCSGSWRCPVVATRSNPCSKAMVEARSEEFLLKSDRPEENNHTKCNLFIIITYSLVYYSLSYLISYNIHTSDNSY